MRECGTVGTRTPTLKRMYNNMTVQIYIHIMIHRDHIAAYLYTIHVYPICMFTHVGCGLMNPFSRYDVERWMTGAVSLSEVWVQVMIVVV